MARTPAAERIVTAAIPHFASRGYDASSLAEIAESVGIRKASLYAHFTGKDQLFLEAFNDALQQEQDFAQHCFAAEPATALPGSHYCNSLIQRYAESAHLRFFLRTSYISPAALEQSINASHEVYLEQLDAAFKQRLQAWQPATGRWSDDDLALHTQVYQGIVDSLQVKLIYTDAAQASLRLQAMQQLFSATLQQPD